MYKNKVDRGAIIIPIAIVIVTLIIAAIITFFMGMAFEPHYEWFLNHKWYEFLKAIDFYQFVVVWFN